MTIIRLPHRVYSYECWCLPQRKVFGGLDGLTYVAVIHRLDLECDRDV